MVSLRRAPSWTAAVVIGAMTAMIFSGCASSGTSGSANEPPPEGTIVGVLVDQTCDASDDLREDGSEAVDIAMKGAASDSGTFIGEAVTTAEYQDGSADVIEHFASKKQGNSAKQRDLNRQAEKALESDDLKAMMTPQTSDCGSDLVGAVAGLASTISDEQNAAERSKDVVFVTNGIVVDEERGWNFVRDSMTPEYTDTVIAALEKEGTLPDLAGASMTFVGLGDREPPISAQKKVEIESFWAAFAEASGANFRDIGNVSQLVVPSPS